jgi:signal transduction histidine kinase
MTAPRRGMWARRISRVRGIPRGHQWTLRSRVITLCVLVAAITGALAATAASTVLTTRAKLDQLLDEVGPMRTAVNDLAAALAGQDAGLRGFVLSGREGDLAPYTLGLAAAQNATVTIGGNPAASAEVQRRLRAVTDLAGRWRTEVAEPAIGLVRAQGPPAAQAFLKSRTSAEYDAMQRAITGLRDVTQAIRDAAVADLRNSSSGLAGLLLVAAMVVLTGGAGIIVLLQRLVTGPVTELAGQVRAAADGRYEHPISATGPPELARLAADVESMRRQIVTDLAEVRQSRRMIEEVNAQLEAQAAELTRSNRDLEQFAYVASHDLQEPLRKIMSFCQLLQRRYAGQLDERADQYIAFAVNGAQRMQRLINDLLAFSRIGRSTTGFIELDLNTVLTEVVGQLDVPDPAAVTWSTLPAVRGDEALVTNLFTNLINNSLKFRRPEQPPSVTLSARPCGDLVEISCTDNGIGIEAEFADKVFVIFQRLHARDAYPGTGMGLAIAKKIVEYHGGQIWVDPDREHGVAVRFTLPAAHPVRAADWLPVAGTPASRAAIEQRAEEVGDDHSNLPDRSPAGRG